MLENKLVVLVALVLLCCSGLQTVRSQARSKRSATLCEANISHVFSTPRLQVHDIYYMVALHNQFPFRTT